VKAPACIGRGFFFALGRGGLWADHVLGVLGGYPLLRVLPLAVSLLQRVTFSKRRKGNPKGFALTFGPLAGARGSFAPGLIRGHRLRFASLHLLSMCSTSSNGRCAPTPGSIPPLSLPTGLQIKIKSCSRANAHPVEWGGFAAWAVHRLKLWERACSRRRPASRPVSCGFTQSNCGSEPAREDGLPADRFPAVWLRLNSAFGLIRLLENHVPEL
jgi:hypothetical protein